MCHQSAVAQKSGLIWPSTPSSLANGSFTYLRIRITSASYNMGAANSTGYYSRGEVEDYRVVVDNTVLGMQLLSFDAETVNNSKVELTWSVNEEKGFMGYNAERSHNGTDWEQVAFIPATGAGTHQYELEDNNPYTGNSFYRLKLNHANGPVRYSAIRSVKVTDISSSISLFPNPATDKVTITIAGDLTSACIYYNCRCT